MTLRFAKSKAAVEKIWPQFLPPPELLIVLLYVAFASLWVVGSDIALDALTFMVHGALDPFVLQTVKGLNFVLTTAVLLYFVLRRAYGGWRRAEQERHAVSERARESLRALSGRLQALREEERSHTAREIHDELGQMLTGLKMELRWIEDRISGREDRTLNPVLDKVVEATELVDATIASVQRISVELRPGVLDNLGLSVALQQEAQRFSERTGIPCTTHCCEEIPVLPRDVATSTFRIFQEALTNVARHAEASSVQAECAIEGDRLILSVKDDGKGIDPSQLDDPKSLGLLGMRERATLLGGEVAFERGADRGTVVRVTIPLDSTAAPPAKEEP